MVGIAQSRRRFHQRVEHRLQIEGRAADDLEHVGSGGLLLQRFPQLVEQPGILYRDDGLSREVLYQLDLLVGERPNLLAVDADHADQLVLLEHRHRDEGAGTAEVHRSHAHRIAGAVRGLCFDVIDVNHSSCSRYSADGGIRAGTNEWVSSALPRICRWDAVQRNRSETVVLAQPQHTELGLAQARCLRQYGLEYWPEVSR